MNTAVMKRAIGRGMRWHRPLMYFTAAMVATAAVSAIGYGIDHRVIAGAPIWAKPLKFSLSFGLYAATLAWFISRLHRPRVARFARRGGTVLAVALALEMAAIVGQVVRGRASHFNQATTFDAAVFAAMGVFVGIIFLATIATAVAVLFESPVTDRATTWAIRLGLVISVAGMSVGFLMLRPTPAQQADPHATATGAHSVGVADGGPSIPLLGWDTTGGDLRIPHFVGLHALQLVPLFALALTLIPATARLTPRTRVQLVFIGACAYGATFALALWQALRGQAITAPDTTTVVAGAVLVAGTIMAAGATVARSRSRLRHAESRCAAASL